MKRRSSSSKAARDAAVDGVTFPRTENFFFQSRMKLDGGWIGVFAVATVLSIGYTKGEIDPRKNGYKDVEDTIDYRLPLAIRPKSYEIILKELPQPGEGTDFAGTVKINVVVENETDEIVFHAGNITVISVAVADMTKLLPIDDEIYDRVTEKYAVKMTEKLAKGMKITLAIEYRGTIRDDMIGLYQSSYVDDKGKTKWLFATQFHAVHARHAFPCFDEPSFKATFVIRILRPRNYIALSNMRLARSTDAWSGVWDIFGESVEMPTYLVAFVISDFEGLPNPAGNFSVWARPNAVQQASFALDVGSKALELLSRLFDESYQLPKLDMVAIPDFAAGAMENWGLITYRESRMLYDENESSVTSEQDVTSVIVHECVHSWFGNLVTPRWWNCLWLSEGFARYYEYMATAKLQPSWKKDQQFVVDIIHTVFADDALEKSPPMTRDVSSQAEIGTTGDTITYSKGASVVRMMELTFGTEIFNSGLRDYLKSNKFSSATPEVLWSALQRQVDIKSLPLGGGNVKTIMDSWTTQPGFPVLSVVVADGFATLGQKRFLLRNPNSVATDSIWWIPVTWTTQKNSDFASTSPRFWFGNESARIPVSVDNDEWIVFNVQEAGYYRVNYDKNSWYRIINVLTSERYEDIHEVNRAAIVDDLMNLARAGDLDYDTALTGLNYIKREKNYLPFKAAFAGLNYLDKRFAAQKSYHYISNFSLSIIDYVYNDLGYDDRTTDDRFMILLRRELNIWACKFDHSECVEKSLNYFKQWRNKNVPVPKNQRPAAYCTAIRHGASDDWDFLWEKYLQSNYAAEKLVILAGLGCSQNTTILEKYLLLAVDEFEKSGIRKQDSKSVFSSVYGSSQFGAEYILHFIANHHSTVAKYYGGYDKIANILSEASQRFSTKELITKFQTLINVHKKDFQTISESLSSSLELAKYELQWFNNNEQDIVAWMNKNGKGDTTTQPTISSTPKDSEEIDTSNTTDYMLPTSIVPKSYDIRLTPYIEPGKFTFDGNVKITASVAEVTDKIVLHINEINIIGIAVSSDGTHVPLKSYDAGINKYDFLTITLTEMLKVGAMVNIEITYTGKLNAAMKGFYRSSYINDADETRWLATTHLEPVGARKMFPCFDEPALKATFTISVNRPSTYNARSNTPLKMSEPEVNGRVWDHFEETPAMSTYLVALIVSDFASLVDEKNNCSVWARPNAIQHTDYALSVMAPLVRFYEKNVGHPYQLRKLDMAAIPDFSSGAMENWGLLTYRESNMIYDKNNSPIMSKQVIADVISHEISHQWFGNEVSPRWWKYLWLSEGFARYFQYHGTAHVETEWGLESQFVTEQLQSAFVTDGLPTSHPMTHDVFSPAEISAIFDNISYAKGASILRMIERTLGRTLFYSALHDYIAARSYKDSIPEYLYEAFQGKVNSTGTKLEASVKTIMDSWTTQSGYPVVDVSVTDGVASLSQKRFLSRNPDNVPTDNVWWIPVTWASKSQPDFQTTTPKYWLSKKEDSLKLNISDEWVIFNVQEAGYYRVNYDTASWNRIIDALKSTDFEVIHEVNRASLIDDLFNLGRSGLVDYGIVLSATQYMNKETNYIPWSATLKGLIYLTLQLNGTDIFELYRTHVVTIVLPTYKKLGFEEVETEPHFDKLLRKLLVNMACGFEVEDCISSSLAYFAKWKSDSSKIVPVNIRNTVYCTALKHGSVDDWEFLWKQYLSTRHATQKQVILSALGCTKNTGVLEKLLTSAITKSSGIRHQDSKSVFSAVYNSGLLGAEYSLDFVDRNYEKMHEYYGDYSTIGSILNEISSRLTTKKLVQKFEKFVNTRQQHLSEIESTMQSSLKRATEDLEWFEKYGPRIYEWLDKTYPSEDYRLPKKIKPIDYDIYLTPYLEEGDFTFDGEIRINMEVLESTSSIVLQANELKINDIIVYIDSINPLEVLSHTLNKTTHKFTIYLTKKVKAGSKLSAYITYTGILNDKMKGFYRSSYIDGEGKTRWLASTQFEPVHARQAFPCFDEPAFKAKFNIHIERPNEYRTLSNMPSTVSMQSSKTNRTWDSYEETRSMSSYLVAFVVSDLEQLKNKNGNFSIWARSDVVKHGAYALQQGQKVLKYMERFTGIGYPIRKMDMVAVPDFSSGAMENWGLVTYREYGLLYHENVTSATYKRYVTTIVSHELAHMWFGNLVTCDWWDHIWLHEGFAQYFQWVVGDSIEPDWKLLHQFVVYELQVAMETDASPEIHPMNNKVSKPQAVADSFDKIAYGKSSSVIRMMHHAFGAAVFEPALRSYLDGKRYGNAKPDDLSSAIQIYEDVENSLGNLSVTVETLMNSWTNQAGFPVVNATWTSGILTLTQQRFLLSDPKEPSDQLNSNFWIPITFTTKNELNFTNTRPAFWFGSRRSEVPLALKVDEWFVLNIQQTGYYRVNYDENSWKKIIAALQTKNFDGIHEINRAQIVDDLLNLARTDYVDYEVALEATKYLVNEQSHLPWKAFFNAVTFLNRRFDGHAIGEVFANYVLGLTEEMYERLSTVEEDPDDQLMQLNRQLILSWACRLRHSGCIETAKTKFDAWRVDQEKWIPPNERPAVYCTSIYVGNHEDWEFLWKAYEKTNFASEKVVILNALGCSKNISTLNSYMKRAISNDNAIRRQDVAAAFSSVYDANKFGVDAALDFVIANYKDIQRYHGSWGSVGSLLSNIASRISTQEQIDKLELFINNTVIELKEISSSLGTSVEAAKENLEWTKTHGKTIHKWLTKVPNESPKPSGGGDDGEDNASGSAIYSLYLLFAALCLVITY